MMPAPVRVQTYGDLYASISALLGRVDLGRVVGEFYDTAEIRTSWTPPVVLDLRDTISSPPSAFTKAMKPTVILRGRAGTHVIAPHGEAEVSTGLPLVVPVVGLVGLGILLARLWR